MFKNHNLIPLDIYIPSLLYQNSRKNPLVYKGFIVFRSISFFANPLSYNINTRKLFAVKLEFFESTFSFLFEIDHDCLQ